MKKIFVTGAGGFIGSHLCEQLVRNGNQVKALVRYNSRNFWGWLTDSPLRKDIEIVSGDLRDFDGISNATRGVDSIFHLGALIGIPYSYESPLAYVKTNVEGTYNVLESARRHGVRRIVSMSTSEVYGTAQYVPIDEKHPLQPQSPYSASKIGADQLALSYFNSFNLPVVVARPFNTYGPRQSARAIIPTIASQLLANFTELKLGNLTPIRDLTYVDDTVSGLIEIAAADSLLGKCVNIGTGDAVSIAELFESLKKITGRSAKVVEDSARLRPDNSEVMRLVSDNSILRKQSNWKPSVNLEDGLKRTVTWLEANLREYKPEIYNI